MAHKFRKNKQQLFIQFMSLFLIVGSVGAIGVQLLYPSHAATGSGTLSLSPASGTVQAGTVINLTITENSGTTTVTSVQADLTFSSSSLQYNGVSASGSQFNDVAPPPTTGNGTVSIFRSNGAGVTGSQNFATVNFTVLKTGTVAFANTSAMYTNAPSAPSIYGGGSSATFTVPVATPAPTPAPTPKPSVTPAPTPKPTATPTPQANTTLSASPTSGSYQVGDNVAVVVSENSGSTGVTTVIPVVNYNSSLLSYKGIDNTGSQFADVAPPVATGAGTLNFTRGSSIARTGSQKVATLNFTALKSGTATVSFGPGSIVYAVTAGAPNVYGGSSTGASYTIQAGSTGVVTSPSSGAGGSATVTTQTLTYKPASGNSSAAPITVAKDSSLTASNNFVVTPVLNDHVSADGTSSPVVKVEYILSGKELASITRAPFSYTVDTRHLRNGTYTLTVTTTYGDGTTKSSSQKIDIKNPYSWTQFSLDAKHYAWVSVPSSVLLLAGLGIAVAFLLRRRKWAFGMAGQDHGLSNYSDPDLRTVVTDASPLTPDIKSASANRIEPTVIVPSTTNQANEDDSHFSSTITLGKRPAAETVETASAQPAAPAPPVDVKPAESAIITPPADVPPASPATATPPPASTPRTINITTPDADEPAESTTDVKPEPPKSNDNPPTQAL